MAPTSSRSQKGIGKRPGRVRRWILRAVGSVLVLILLLGLFTQTGLFRDWLRGVIVETANQSLAARLDVGELDGNLITNVTVSNISIAL